MRHAECLSTGFHGQTNLAKPSAHRRRAGSLSIERQTDRPLPPCRRAFSNWWCQFSGGPLFHVRRFEVSLFAATLMTITKFSIGRPGLLPAATIPAMTAWNHQMQRPNEKAAKVDGLERQVENVLKEADKVPGLEIGFVTPAKRPPRSTVAPATTAKRRNQQG
ncbi:hypothetical protein IWX90DRAFT_177669 [Phyllosticta citrichinensis]|uniref:Uncharacterized protein n=1 Tax=Phyllosticta citrichinensis TaxID=1130410 RepID=A0ABR1XVL3_9PEZI